MEKNQCSKFTGRIYHPVVIRRENENRTENKLEIDYRFGDGSCETPLEEDWTLPLEAFEKKDGSYDIWAEEKLIANAPDFESAKQEIGKYIDDKGNFKGLEKEITEK